MARQDIPDKQRDQIARFFHDEVEAIRGLDHPHIIKLVGLAVDKDQQRLMFAMELMLGGSLRGLLSRAQQDPTLVTPAMRDGWLRQLYSALAFIHGKGKVHRDIKSDNLLLSEDLVTLKVRMRPCRGEGGGGGGSCGVGREVSLSRCTPWLQLGDFGLVADDPAMQGSLMSSSALGTCL